MGFDSEHPKARLSVSTGAKIENLMSVKMKNNIKQITEVNQIKYITKMIIHKNEENNLLPKLIMERAMFLKKQNLFAFVNLIILTAAKTYMSKISLKTLF